MYDQVWMTGWRLTSSMPAMMRCLSSCFDVTRCALDAACLWRGLPERCRALAASRCGCDPQACSRLGRRCCCRSSSPKSASTSSPRPHEVLAIALWVTMAWVHESAATHSAFLVATSAEQYNLGCNALPPPTAALGMTLRQCVIYRADNLLVRQHVIGMLHPGFAKVAHFPGDQPIAKADL